MLNIFRIFLFLMIGWVVPFQASAMDKKTDAKTSHVKMELLQEEETVQPNQPFWIALHLKLEEGWHVYWKNPGDAGIPLKVEWNLPDGFKAGPLQWPFPEKFTVSEMVGFGYSDEVVLLSQITPPAQMEPNSKYNLKAQIHWLICSEKTCQPGSASADLPLKIALNQPQRKAVTHAIFEKARTKIPKTHVEVKTIRKEGIVQLQVPQDNQNSSTDTIRNAYFFPEQKDVIDHTIDPTVAQSTADSNRYFVNLKGSDVIGAKNKTLKGVLVLHTKKGTKESIQAIDVNSPIHEETDHSLLSFLDASNILSIGSDTTTPSVSSSTSYNFQGGLSLALLFAFLGGIILNLMPCVLPVMSFKVMSFIKMARESRSLTLKHGLMFSVGVIISFWILASVMLMLRTYGKSVGWGFQLQEPLFVVILASILFIFALSLFGLFEWGMFFASWAGQKQAEKTQKSTGFTGSFLSGVLATAVATPCTGPFLGSAVGFAVTLPMLQSLMIFTSLGIGMSFPYLVLAAFPAYLRFLPKPGAWMEIFKQLMGFILLATVVWLLWVFSAQTDTFSLICLLAGFLFFAMGGWIYGKGCTPLISRKKRVFAYVFVLLFAIMGTQVILFPRAGWYNQDNIASKSSKQEWAGWEEFSPERVAQLRNEGKPVLIDFTAKWCLICQANHLVLDSENVQKELNNSGVIKMKADWTKSDPVITEALSKFGRNSVPLYVLYGPDQNQEPIILPQVLTADVVLKQLNKAVHTDGVALKQ